MMCAKFTHIKLLFTGCNTRENLGLIILTNLITPNSENKISYFIYI